MLPFGLEQPDTAQYSIEWSRNELKSIQQILGDKQIDVYAPARLPPGAPKEEVFQTYAQLKKEGLFREVGASELSAATLEIFHKVGGSPVIIDHPS